MREKQVEQALVKAVKARGGICPKFVSPGLSGVPDRLVLMPHGKIAFVEVKAPKKKPKSLTALSNETADGFGVQVLCVG